MFNKEEIFILEKKSYAKIILYNYIKFVLILKRYKINFFNIVGTWSHHVILLVIT